jgi:plasmid stability protein
MASITIRRLDEDMKARLQVRASRHGRTMEDEAREILKVVLTDQEATGRVLAESIRQRFASLGGVELAEMPPEPVKQPLKFGK